MALGDAALRDAITPATRPLQRLAEGCRRRPCNPPKAWRVLMLGEVGPRHSPRESVRNRFDGKRPWLSSGAQSPACAWLIAGLRFVSEPGKVGSCTCTKLMRLYHYSSIAMRKPPLRSANDLDAIVGLATI